MSAENNINNIKHNSIQLKKDEGKTLPHPGSNNGGVEARPEGSSERIPVLKTYKIFIGGAFPRSESGHYYRIEDAIYGTTSFS